VKFCDFGISRKVNFKTYIGQRRIATDEYLSPEELLMIPATDPFASGNYYILLNNL
jgi:hypothetical protein